MKYHGQKKQKSLQKIVVFHNKSINMCHNLLTDTKFQNVHCVWLDYILKIKVILLLLTRVAT